MKLTPKAMLDSIEVLHGSHVAWQEQWKYFAYERTSFPMGKGIFCSCHAIWLPCKTSINGVSEENAHVTMLMIAIQQDLNVLTGCAVQCGLKRSRADKIRMWPGKWKALFTDRAGWLFWLWINKNRYGSDNFSNKYCLVWTKTSKVIYGNLNLLMP